MGTKFKDNAQREWDVALNIDTLKRVKQRLDIDLMAKNLLEVLQHVIGNYVVLGDVLFVVVQPQAELAKVTDVEFGRSLAGDSIDHATLALLDAIRDFTPNPRDRARVGMLLETITAAATTFHALADEAMTRAAKEVPEKIRSGLQFSSSPASSESNPGG